MCYFWLSVMFVSSATVQKISENFDDLVLGNKTEKT
jgi:hypothetical protein